MQDGKRPKGSIPAAVATAAVALKRTKGCFTQLLTVFTVCRILVGQDRGVTPRGAGDGTSYPWNLEGCPARAANLFV